MLNEVPRIHGTLDALNMESCMSLKHLLVDVMLFLLRFCRIWVLERSMKCFSSNNFLMIDDLTYERVVESSMSRRYESWFGVVISRAKCETKKPNDEL